MGSSNRREGILRSVREGSFSRVAATVTTCCLRYHAGILYVCADEAEDGFLLGSSGDDGEHVDPLSRGARASASPTAATGFPVSTCNDLWPPRADDARTPSTRAPSRRPSSTTPPGGGRRGLPTRSATDVALDAPADVPGDAHCGGGADVTAR